MLNLSKLLSALWGILGLLALITLFMVYANFPDYANLDFLGIGAEAQFDRHRFFFVFSGIYLAVNVIIYITIRATLGLGRVSRSVPALQHLRTLVSLKTLVIGANLFLVPMMVFTRSAVEMQSLAVNGFWILLWIGPVVMGSGLLYLLYVVLFPVRNSG